MEHADPFAIVQAWQAAVNRQDVARLLELSAPDIEIVGPRGTGRGHQLLRDWLGRAGLQLRTLRAFARDDVVVVEQHGVWRSVETGGVAGEGTIACCFRVADQRVARFARYDSLDAALDQAKLNGSDEIARG